MSGSRRILPRSVEWIVVALIVIGLYAVLLPAVRVTRNPRGPHGRMIPVEPPQELNRIHHETGLSIVLPPNWEQVFDHAPGMPHLFVAPRGAPGRRLKSFIAIQPIRPPGEDLLGDCTPLVYQGFKAHERMRIEREDTFDDPATSRYQMCVDRDGIWWRVEFVIADAMTTLPERIREYIDTIEFPADRMNAVTTSGGMNDPG